MYLLQENKSLGLDYFICQVNIDCLTSLTNTIGDRLLDITPSQLNNMVDVAQGDAVYIIQHPKGKPRSISSYSINYVLGM